MARKPKAPTSVRRFLAEAGKNGGRARKVALSDEQRSEIARNAARVRWKVDGAVLEAKIIEEPLDNLLVATANRLEREWPASLPGESAVCLRGLLLVSRNTFRTIRYFCADRPLDTARKLEYSLTAIPLGRLILEAVFNTAFLLEDLPARTNWYMKAGWADMNEDYERLKRSYGKDGSWKDYLDSFAVVVEKGQKLLRLTPDEVAKPKTISWWPRHSKMCGLASPDLSAYLEYLGDWFYKEMSEDAHLRWNGLVRLAGPLLQPEGDPEAREQLLKRQRSNAIATSAILQLALVSEIALVPEIARTLELEVSKLRYLWAILNEHFLAGKEVY